MALCQALYTVRRTTLKTTFGLPRGETSGTLAFMRWSTQKSEQFQALRDAEANGLLTAAERVLLDGLLADLDADEAEALQPAQERLDAEARAMDAEKAELDVKAAALERIAREEELLLAEAQAFVTRLQQRSAALAEDFQRVTGYAIAPAR